MVVSESRRVPGGVIDLSSFGLCLNNAAGHVLIFVGTTNSRNGENCEALLIENRNQYQQAKKGVLNEVETHSQLRWRSSICS